MKEFVGSNSKIDFATYIFSNGKVNKVLNSYKENNNLNKGIQMIEQLSLSIISSNKQLHQLHKQIMDLHSHYQLSQQQYTAKIKYRIKESINTAECLKEGHEEFDRKQQLQTAFARDDVQQQMLDQTFTQLFMQQYLESTLASQVVGNDIFVKKLIEDKKLQAYPYSGLRPSKQQAKQRESSIAQQKELQILSKETVENSINSVKYQLEKQKHTNATLYEQVLLLEKELQHLNSYCDSNQSQSLIGRPAKNDIDSGEIHSDFNSEPQITQTTDDELSAQVDCLERLIKSKTQLISDLSHSNHLLRLKTNELHSKQVYLNKKRLLLQSHQLPKLQHRLNLLLNQIKAQLPQNLTSLQQTLSLQTERQTDQKPCTQHQNAKNTLHATTQQLSDIHHLIQSTLAQAIMEQKTQFVQNHLF